mmetsp:Transcript_42801/g.81684  ORF Transcript_42801/g.81684 Transcript_42801/m.81684 type:complete len:648 (+) Transcript_42801:291-2234(+)
MYKMQRHPTAAVMGSLFVLQCAFCFTATGLQVGFGHNIGKASTRRLLGEEQKQTPPSSGQVSVESIGDKVPLMGGLVDKLLSKPIPFVESESVSSMDSDAPTTGANIPVVGGLVSRLLGTPGPPLDFGHPGPPAITEIPFGIGSNDDNDDPTTAQSVSAESASGSAQTKTLGDEVPIVGSMVDRIMARPIPFVGEDDKESAESAQQVKAQSTTGDSVPIVGGLVDTTLNDAMHGPVGSALSGDGSSDSDDIPVVNGLVNRTLEDHHRIPFVDPKDSDESAQSVRSMDVASGPSSPSSPTDAVASPTTLADIPVAGEFLEDILGRPGPPLQLGQPVPPFNVAPAPPIITTLPFGIGEDDQDNKDYQDDQVVQSVKTEMVHKESEPGDSVPIVGGLVNNVLATPLPPLNREPPLNYGPPIITDIPLIDVVDSDVGSLDSDLAGAARAHTQSVNETDPEETSPLFVDSDGPLLPANPARPLLVISPPPLGPPPDVSLGPPFAPWNSGSPLVHAEPYTGQGEIAQSGVGIPIKNDYKYPSMVVAIASVVALVSLSTSAVVVYRNRINVDEWDAEDAQELVKLLPDEMQKFTPRGTGCGELPGGYGSTGICGGGYDVLCPEDKTQDHILEVNMEPDGLSTSSSTFEPDHNEL